MIRTSSMSRPRKPVLGELLLERRERAVVRRPGVDERHRLAPEQPEVHGSDPRDRNGDGGDIGHGKRLCCHGASRNEFSSRSVARTETLTGDAQVPDARRVRRSRSARQPGRGDARQELSPLRGGAMVVRRLGARGLAGRQRACRNAVSTPATTSPSGCRPAPDVLRCWFGANAIGATYSPLTLAAKGSYLEHTLNLAESKVLVAHTQLLERLVGRESAAPRARAHRRRRGDGREAALADGAARRDPRGRLGRAPDADAGRPSRGTT